MRHQDAAAPLVSAKRKLDSAQPGQPARALGSPEICEAGHRSAFGDDYRNFAVVDPGSGVTAGPRGEDIFKGYEAVVDDPSAAERCNVQLLKRLAREINETRIVDAVAENKSIPAGYTYLAQFVTHDFTHNVASLPDRTTEAGIQTNMRALPLMLATMYGGGPGANPLCYDVGRHKGRFRARLRVGRCQETGEHVVYQDLPRVRSVAEQDCAVSGNTCPVGMPDVLIADVRNDDTPMLAQIQVLFHLLHNKLVDEYEKYHDAIDFMSISRVVAYVYRNIIKNDLLRRLLHSGVCDAYASGELRCMDGTTDLKVPVEFSNSALRIGQVMVRNEYTFNNLIKRPIDLALMNNSYHSYKMPLQGDWVINWARFFDLDGTYQGSRKIRPWIASILADVKFPDPDGSEFSNIMERDLLRGLFARQWSAYRLISRLAPHLPKEIARYPLMSADDARRKLHMEFWLREHGTHLTEADAQVIKDDPPLFFYILLEASLPKSEGGGDGRHLGVLGSILLADVFFKFLRATDHLIDAPAGPPTAEKAEKLFAGKVPANMPELVRTIPLWDVDACCPV